MDILISDLIIKLVKIFNKLKIEYVFVGGIAAITFGRVRATTDLEIIVNHTNLDRVQFVKLLQEAEFDTTLDDLANFDEKLHVSFFHKNTIFRIDMKGIYPEKDKSSINEAFESAIRANRAQY